MENNDFFSILTPAIIGAVSAIIIMIIKDLIFYNIRERKKNRLELLDRRLTNIYSPLYLVCVSANNMITTFVKDDVIYEKLNSNMHLLSPELSNLLNEHFKLCHGDFRNPQMDIQEQRKAIDISDKFIKQVKKETELLRAEYLNTKST